jgi:hypothetical protein
MSNGKIYTEGGSHWYFPDGKPCFEIPKAKGDGTRAPTVADARKLGLLPSVTGIINLLNKPALNDWKAKQVANVLMKAKQNDGESMDDFFERVISKERLHEQESRKAMDTGTIIHDCLEQALSGKEWDKDWSKYVEPALVVVMELGRVVWSEKVLVGNGYAGRADVLIQNDTLKALLLTDFKTTSKPPDKESWPEHRLQTAAYAATLGNTNGYRILTCNLYISTKDPGVVRSFTQNDWLDTYNQGFKPLLQYWQWANKHWPGKKGTT